MIETVLRNFIIVKLVIINDINHIQIIADLDCQMSSSCYSLLLGRDNCDHNNGNETRDRFSITAIS